jgi:hypothetical protein
MWYVLARDYDLICRAYVYSTFIASQFLQNFLASSNFNHPVSKKIMSNIFRQRRTSYQPRIAPLEDRLRELERLDRIFNGESPRSQINTGLLSSHHQLQQDLDMLDDEDGNLVDQENSLQAEHFNTGNHNPEPLDEDFNNNDLLDHARSYHTQVNQQAHHQSVKNNWDNIMSTLLGAYLFLKSETKNWTMPEWTKDLSSLFCDCGPSEFHHRKVDLIDLNCRFPSVASNISFWLMLFLID